mmetsp:Transcript_68834/g.157974  ORF Transcript_68834/g.157974 Transcript_68834/m.157974 type:complete len:229 (+) Transcript_68834:1622-2308(+)
MPFLGPGPGVLRQRCGSQACLHSSLSPQHSDHRADQDADSSPVWEPLILRVKGINSLWNEEQRDQALEQLPIQRHKIRQKDFCLTRSADCISQLHPEFNGNLRDVRVWKSRAQNQNSEHLLHFSTGPLCDHNIKKAFRSFCEDSRKLGHHIQAVLVVLQGLLQHRPELRRNLHNLWHQSLNDWSVLLGAGCTDLERLNDALSTDLAELWVLDISYAQRKQLVLLKIFR